MGLDMYVNTANITPLAARQVDFQPEDTSEDGPELFYWRNHYCLHWWMEDLYRVKGGAAKCFNITVLRLMPEDISALLKSLAADSLPKARGAIYGAASFETLDHDLKFILKAREALRSGLAIYYTSMW